MPADQAAGLRRCRVRRSARITSVFAAHPNSALRLADTLKAGGARVLLIDTEGSGAHQAQSIFGWRQQIARQCLQTISMQGVEVLNAPGAQAGEASIVAAGGAYDHIVFDMRNKPSGTLELDTAIQQTLIVEVHAQTERVCHVYSLLKTLSQTQPERCVILWGAPASCERLVAACAQFMGSRIGVPEVVAGWGDTQMDALAAKITATQTGDDRFYNDTGGVCTQYG